MTRKLHEEMLVNFYRYHNEQTWFIPELFKTNFDIAHNLEIVNACIGN